MTILLLLPTILSVLTLGAHYVRIGAYPLVLLLLLLLLLLQVKRRWVLRLMQLVLVVSTVVWITVLYDIARERAMNGLGSRKSGIILGGTALFTLFSAALLQAPPLRRRYAPREKTSRTS